MKMMHIQILFLITLLPIASCKESHLPTYETKVTTILRDENDHPAQGVKVVVTHDCLQPHKNTERISYTDHEGKAITSAISLPSIWVRTNSQDYYPTFEEEVSNIANPYEYTRTPLKELEHKIIVRKIINPIALYAKQNDIPIPQNDKWIGFDFEIADWVKPFGNGIETDVEFWLSNQCVSLEYRGKQSLDTIQSILEDEHKNEFNKKEFFKSPSIFFEKPPDNYSYENIIPFRFGKWTGTLKMRVPHEKGGIFAEKNRYLAYSKNPKSDYPNQPVPEMRMPHHAPADGYGGEVKWEKTTSNDSIFDKKLGFFIKTRIKLDEKGNVISSNYAKFISDVEIDIRGRIKFTSYFNPTPNDTNLEFDVKKNLFYNLKDLEKPFLP